MSSNSPVRCTASIKRRLTLLYLGSTFILLICVLGFLMRTIIADLEFEDSDFLNERIYSIHHMLTNHENQFSSIRLLVESTSTNHHTRSLIRILDQNAHVLLESPEMKTIIPSDEMPLVDSNDQLGSRSKGERHWGKDGKLYLLKSMTLHSTKGNAYTIQAALDITDELKMFKKYQRNMLITLFACMLIAALISRQVVKQGLKPLDELAASLKEITATDLHQRLGSRCWPHELSRLTSVLDMMLERLENSFKRLKEFSSNLAHELRTPLNIVRGEAEVCLAAERTPEEYQEVLTSAVEEYTRLSHTIDDMLFLANSEQLKHITRMDARSELETLMEFFIPLAEEQQVSLTLTASGTLDADRTLFQRVIVNVISNAIKYTPAGGSVSILASNDEEQNLTITVSDTGIGISPEDQELVFDRFYRTAPARQQQQAGSGLGLAIVRSIMELHNGSVTLTSQAGQGTTITLWFPAQRHLI